MPWWAIIYLATYVAVILIGIAWYFRKSYLGIIGTTQWLSDIPTPIIWSYFFAAFWIPQLSSILGFISPILILGAIVWDVYTWPDDMRDINEDPELDGAEKWFMKLFSLIIQLPAYVFATIAAFRDYIHF